MATPDEDVFTCSYCLTEKPVAERSDEHIWPEGLGGDPVGPPWRTDNVCGRCNSLAGQWVDGAFIRGWFGTHERASGAEDYLDPAHPEKAIAQFRYMGVVEPDELRPDETAEVWIGPAGETVLHVRPKHDDVWNAYAGGKPTRKRAEGGHAYLLFTSPEMFWVLVALWSFQKQFRRAHRTLINSDTPETSPPLAPIDPGDAEQARHIRMARSLQGGIKASLVVDLDYSNRFLCKLALGVGRELWGEAYLKTSYAGHLSRALWERDFEVRQTIPVRGSGFFGGLTAKLSRLPLAWPGGWLLLLMKAGGLPCLVVLTPDGKAMITLLSDDPALADALPISDEGEIHVVVPAVGTSAGPIPFEDYLAFVTGVGTHPELQRLQSLRRDPSTLPPKRIGEDADDDGRPGV